MVGLDLYTEIPSKQKGRSEKVIQHLMFCHRSQLDIQNVP